MNEIKWIKLSVDMFDDEKIKLLEKMPEGDTMIVIWCKLLTMAGKANTKGYIMLTENLPYTEDMLVTIIDRPSSVVKMALNVFEKFGMIEFDTDENAYMLMNWTKHQNIEGMEKQKELNKLRQKRYRERKKQDLLPNSVANNNESNVTHNVTDDDDVTLYNGAREKKEERREKKEEKENKALKDKPSAQQVDQQKFESIWKHYPKKIDKKKALASYTRAIKKGTDHETIENGLMNYLRYLKVNESWLKPQDGGRWFEKERWNDEYDMTPPNDKRNGGRANGTHQDAEYIERFNQGIEW